MLVDQETIDSWKEKYKFVFRATIEARDYYFRCLTRDDYIAIQQKAATVEEGQAFDNELEMVSVCLLAPELTLEDLKARAGVVSVLSEKIMLRSGFQVVEEEQL